MAKLNARLIQQLAVQSSSSSTKIRRNVNYFVSESALFYAVLYVAASLLELASPSNYDFCYGFL